MPTSPSFTKMATVTASTKRPATISAGGKRASPATQIASLKCFPLDPISKIDQETRRRTNTNTPYDLLVTYCEAGLNIVQGDILVVGSTEYPIESVGDWTWRGSTYMKLIIEKHRAS